MSAASGPVQYVFLRREGVPKPGDPAGWPPEGAQASSEGAVAAAVQLVAAAHGWQVTPLQTVPPVSEIPEDALVLSRDTELGFSAGRPTDMTAALLGVRIEDVSESEPARLVHLVVGAKAAGSGRRMGQPTVVPAEALVLAAYEERGGQSAAALALKLAPGDLARMPQWMLDIAVERLAAEAVDRAVLLPHARHLITLEVQAGRVSLHGRAELVSYAEAAERELLATPGVVDVADHLLIDESLTDAVEQALADKGITTVTALAEHRLISLHGTVSDATTRRTAEDIATRVTGVRGVVNRIEVRALDKTLS